jgi:hypothetical protein
MRQQILPRRKLKRFTEVVGKIGIDRHIKRLAEAMDLTEARPTDPKVDLNYYTICVPMRSSDEDKWDKLSEMVEIARTVENSDVILVAMWVSPSAA